MKDVWITDATPVIALSGIGQADLLEELSSGLLIPQQVAEEIRSSPAREWVALRLDRCRVDVSIHPAVAAMELGAGESGALSLALLRPGTLILDDLGARNHARELGLPMIGTLGVLVRAKRKGLIPRIRPHIEKLLRSDFRISQRLIARALLEVGE